MADYEKMWEDLGMDVKNHDNLCQVLPTAVGDVFMTQENRPKAMDFWIWSSLRFTVSARLN